MERICGICGGSFKVPPSKVNVGQGKFCSRKCAIQSLRGAGCYNWKGGRPKRICSNCGKEFERYDSHMAKPGKTRTTDAVFCSTDCAKPSVETDKRGYVRRKQPHHPFACVTGFVLEHRLVAEKKLGRFLSKDESAHHINGDKRDNSENNIAVLQRIAHHEYHRAMQLKKLKPNRTNLEEWLRESGNVRLDS